MGFNDWDSVTDRGSDFCLRYYPITAPRSSSFPPHPPPPSVKRATPLFAVTNCRMRADLLACHVHSEMAFCLRAEELCIACSSTCLRPRGWHAHESVWTWALWFSYEESVINCENYQPVVCVVRRRPVVIEPVWWLRFLAEEQAARSHSWGYEHSESSPDGDLSSSWMVYNNTYIIIVAFPYFVNVCLSTSCGVKMTRLKYQ